MLILKILAEKSSALSGPEKNFLRVRAFLQVHLGI